MHEPARTKLSKTIADVHARCVQEAYRIHADMMQEGLINCPADVGQLVSLIDEVMHPGEGEFFEDLTSYSQVQVLLIEKATAVSCNPWELMAIIAHVSAYLLAGCGTLAMIRAGRGEAGGVWLGHSLS